MVEKFATFLCEPDGLFDPDNEVGAFEELEPLLKIKTVINFAETMRRFVKSGQQAGNGNTSFSTRLVQLQSMNWGFPHGGEYRLECLVNEKISEREIYWDFSLWVTFARFGSITYPQQQRNADESNE